jgi:O-antigen ligase
VSLAKVIDDEYGVPLSDHQSAPLLDEHSAPMLTVVLVGLFALTFPLGYAWDLGFSGLAALGGVLSIPALRNARPPLAVILPLVALAGWGLVSLTWSRAAVDPRNLHRYADIEKLTGIKLVLQLGLYGALVAASQKISTRGAQRALTALVLALTALGLAVMLDALQSGAAYAWISAQVGQHIPPDIARRNIAQGDYVIVLLFWCAAVRATQMHWSILSLITAACVFGSSLFLHAVDATLAAFGLGLATFIMVRWMRLFGVVVLGVATTVYWIAAPLVVLGAVRGGLIGMLHHVVQKSWDQRLDMWTFAAAKIVQKPWAGWGLDASRTFGSAISLHTHDAAMQIWLELGAVGAAMAAVFWIGVWSLIEAMVRKDRTAGAAASATAVAYLTIGALSFGVWQEWWLGLGAMAAVACICLARSRFDARIADDDELVPLGG